MNGMPYAMRGAVLLEAVIAMLVFAVGVTGALLLVATAVRENSAMQYRAQAALLIDSAIANIWTGDRSHAGIVLRFADTAAEFVAWKKRVAMTLPGTDGRPPSIQVSPDSTVTISVFWRTPGSSGFHELVSVTKIGQ